MSGILIKECLETPPVVSEGYELKGEYITFNGKKTYVTGSPTSKRAILFSYDIHGFASQTQQGADMIAAMVGAIVIMPDILDGGRDMSKLPTDPEEKKKAMDAWWAGPGHLPTVSKFVRDCAEAIKPAYPSVEKIGAIGLCYGGKVTILAENYGAGVFDATAQAHPGRLSAEDAKKLTSPHLCMASKDEDAADVKAFDAVEKPKGSVTCTYEDMFHGWMGARAKLAEENYANEYKKGYEQFSKWFLNIVA